MRSRGSSASSSWVNSATTRIIRLGIIAKSATPPPISNPACRPLSHTLTRKRTSLDSALLALRLRGLVVIQPKRVVGRAIPHGLVKLVTCIERFKPPVLQGQRRQYEEVER